jgi:diaminohydroxyphosphoribosylaminopyrimidine deaminase/5-amino-6-(5-phosphoribosylamino)uracil reductase
VVLDSQLRLPPSARLLQPPGKVLVACTSEQAARADILRQHGAEVRTSAAAPDGGVDLGALMRGLGQQGINEVHVEAGARLNGALLAGGHVDELLLYLAPAWLGQGAGIAELQPPVSLDQARRGRFVDAVPLGPDLRLRWRTGAGPKTWG